MTSVMPRKRTTGQPQPATPDVIAAAKNMIEKAKANIVLDHPFFSTILLKKQIVCTEAIPTMAVKPDGTILYNPAFVAHLPLKQAIFGVVHEILHYASGHSMRRKTRDPRKWNIAGDMWINDTLRKAGFELIPGCIDVPGSADRTEEDIYASLPDDEGGGEGDDEGGGGGGGGSGGDQGQGDDPLGDDVDDDGGQSMSESEAAELDAQRKIEVAEAANVAKMRGKLPGVLQKFATDTIASRVPWYDILHRHMQERVAVDTSWARPNRRYAPDFYMPTRDSEGRMGEVVIQVDISGSVSHQEIKHYNGHMKRIVEQCKPSKVHVIYTDTEVQKHDEFDSPDDVSIEYHSGGGTDMRDGFRYIKEKGIEPAVFITLTDGYTPFPDTEDVPSIWCISASAIKSPTGTSVHFDMND